MGKEKGSITLEAAISLVVTMSVVLTLSLFARVVYVHGVVQHALIQTANEYATFGYFYSLAGLNQIDGAVNSKLADANNDIEGAVKKIEDVEAAFNSKDVKGAANAVSDIGLGDVVQLFKSLVGAGVGKAAQEVKTTVINEVTKKFLESYFPDKENFYKFGMFVDEDGQYVKDNSKFPINLDESSYFENADADEVHIVAVYNIRPIVPIPIIDKNITIVQNAKARAWTALWVHPPDAEGENKEEESVWDLPDAQRAEKIASTNPALNLNKNFKGMRGFDPETGKASLFVTIDLNQDSYKGKSSSVKSRVKRKLTELENFSGYNLAGKSVSVDDIKAVDYYIYIPTDASEADKAAVRNMSFDDVELDNGEKVKVNVIVQEVK